MYSEKRNTYTKQAQLSTWADQAKTFQSLPRPPSPHSASAGSEAGRIAPPQRQTYYASVPPPRLDAPGLDQA